MDPRRVVLPQGASGTVDSPCAFDGAVSSSLGRTTGVSRYLRAHPEAARAYANIKRALAASSKDDIEAYRTGEHMFVEETTAKARAWRANAGDQ